MHPQEFYATVVRPRWYLRFPVLAVALVPYACVKLYQRLSWQRKRRKQYGKFGIPESEDHKNFRRNAIVLDEKRPPAPGRAEAIDKALQQFLLDRALVGMSIHGLLWKSLLKRLLGRKWKMAQTYLQSRIEAFVKVTSGRTFFEKVAKLDDYSLAMISTTFLDELLAYAIIIKTRRIVDKTLFTQVFKGDSAPLSRFSYKIRVARLMGILSDDVFHDLGILKKIRNDFAHNEIDKQRMFIDFSEKETSDRCKQLKLHIDLSDPTMALAGTAERKAFLSSVATIMINLQVFVQAAALEVKIIERHKDELLAAMKLAAEKSKRGETINLDELIPPKSPVSA